mmetsp:Transcript_11866/g.13682  ORF Transcript_11866/g.13682 Transcript_11866/m.13682 type:complete len:252 (+) Transcript_11866:52-807(+)
MKRVGIIPCRFGSSRFPGKPLASILGKPMVAWTYKSALASSKLDRIYVTSESKEILDAAEKAGAPTILTSSDCKTGTDRVKEAVEQLSDSLSKDAIVVNIQGDEPLIRGDHIDACVSLLECDVSSPMSTIAVEETNDVTFQDPNVVKAVKDVNGNALYFSRAPIPFQNSSQRKSFLRHIGLYAYRRNFLLSYSKLQESFLEDAEGLEQLRVLEAGEKIKIESVKGPCYPGVDTPNDLEAIVKIVLKQRDHE